VPSAASAATARARGCQQLQYHRGKNGCGLWRFGGGQSDLFSHTRIRDHLLCKGEQRLHHIGWRCSWTSWPPFCSDWSRVFWRMWSMRNHFHSPTTPVAAYFKVHFPQNRCHYNLFRHPLEYRAERHTWPDTCAALRTTKRSTSHPSLPHHVPVSPILSWHTTARMLRLL